jgi:hypothetical protein
MPLRKLWNSIRGESAASADGAAVHRESDPPECNPSTKPVRQAATVRGAATRDDKKLFKRIESMSIQSILQVTVGDGQRTLAMLKKLTHKGHSTTFHYIAIDEFEMAGGPLTLREFHKQLREYPAKAHLVPMPIDSGLDRVVRTYGQVDLIIWSADLSPTAKQLDAIARLSKPTTLLYLQDENGRWIEKTSVPLTSRRAA